MGVRAKSRDVRERLATTPAKLEFTGAGLAAAVANFGRGLRHALFIVGDHRAGVLFLLWLRDPDLRVG